MTCYCFYYLQGVSLGVQTDPSTAKALFAGVASHAALMAVAVALVAVPAWVAAGWSAAKVAAVLGAMVLMRPIGDLSAPLPFSPATCLSLPTHSVFPRRHGRRSLPWQG